MTDDPNRPPDERADLIPHAQLWDALVREPTTGVTVVRVDGKILYANAVAAQLFFEREPSDIAGKSIQDLLPPEAAREPLENLQIVARGERPYAVRAIRHGRQLCTTARRIETSEGEPDHILGLVRHVIGEWLPDGDYEYLESRTVDLGRLEILTPRELEVLALIGEGLSSREIAGILGCATRTVEAHRAAIRGKLHETDRVRLARIAAEAGLELTDAKRTRVQWSDPPGSGD